MKYLICSIFFLVSINSFSQEDNVCSELILHSGDIIEGKVEEVGIEIIKYKKCENISGPVYSILKSDVFITVKSANIGKSG